MGKRNPSRRRGITHSTFPLGWYRPAVALSAGAVGTAFCGLLLAPLAHADSAPALPAAGADVGNNIYTSDAYGFLYDSAAWYASPNAMPNGMITAWGDYNMMNGDAGEAFAQLFGPEVAMDSEIWQDIASAGQLVEGAIGDGTEVAGLAISAAPAAAILPGNLPDPEDYGSPTTLPTTDVDVSADTTASHYFTGVINEANIVTQSLDNLREAVGNDSALAGLGANDKDVIDVFNDVLAFQKQINGAINVIDTSPLSSEVTEYDDNGALITDLKGLLSSELNLNQYTIEAEQILSASSVTGLGAIDGDFIGNSWAEYEYTQDVINFFGEPDYLHAIGL